MGVGADQFLRAALLALSAASISERADASWLDNDFYCRVYGCVVVHDGRTFDVYDVYRFADGGTVSVGQPLVKWSGNPFEGTGTVNPVYTGTRTEAFYGAPIADQGVELGIDRNGNGRPNGQMIGNNDGVLDAGDAFDPFSLGQDTDLVTAETSAQRSFYLSSRTDFFLAGQVTVAGDPDRGDAPIWLQRISLDYDIQANGNDDGMAFGQDAVSAGWQPFQTAPTLAELYNRPRYLGEFRNAIRRRSSSSVARQSVRFDYVYRVESYDLSLGSGLLDYEIEFTFYNR